MSSIKTTERLLKRACLTNLFLPDGIAITPLLSGAHGLGKSAIAKQVAKDLKGYAVTIDCSTIKEGEITGIPFAQTTEDGSKEVRFVPYFQTARIAKLEKKVYEQAKKGFLKGTVKLNDDGSTTYTDSTGEHVIPAITTDEQILTGVDNQYAFGEALPAEIKLRLLQSGEITPVVINFDEMNRTDNQTMKEFMNILLGRIVNGYKFPWWVFMVGAVNPCGQDSVYSTNELDAAQLDRFLKIKVGADLNEWVDYAIDRGLNQDYILALSTADEVFQTKGKGYDDSEDDLGPTPRSHEICSYIYDTSEVLKNSGYFTPEEMQNFDDDTRALIMGKIGVKAGRVVMSNLKNRENFIDPAKLITGKSSELNKDLVTKIMGMKMLAKHILMRNVIKHISTTSIKTYYSQGAKSAEDASTAKNTWSKMLAQIKEFFGLLDGATQVIFAKTIYTTKVNIADPKFAKYNEKTLFSALSGILSMEIIEQVAMVDRVAKSDEINQK